MFNCLFFSHLLLQIRIISKPYCKIFATAFMLILFTTVLHWVKQTCFLLLVWKVLLLMVHSVWYNLKTCVFLYLLQLNIFVTIGDVYVYFCFRKYCLHYRDTMTFDRIIREWTMSFVCLFSQTKKTNYQLVSSYRLFFLRNTRLLRKHILKRVFCSYR